MYNKNANFYEEKSFDCRNWTVHGLVFGGKGCYQKSVIDFLMNSSLIRLDQLNEIIYESLFFFFEEKIVFNLMLV